MGKVKIKDKPHCMGPAASLGQLPNVERGPEGVRHMENERVMETLPSLATSELEGALPRKKE